LTTQLQFKKDEETGVIVNTDDTQYNEILVKRQQTKERQDMANRLTKIENDLLFIKNSLQTLLSGK
jgi:hypothetical protein